MARVVKTASVIWLHGLGDTSAGWSFLEQELGPRLPHIRWIFPNAPMIPITVNNGYVMPGWFDVRDIPLTEKTPDDRQGVLASAKTVHKLAEEEEKKGIPSDRIIVGGFSQGAAVSLIAGLTYPRKLGGIVSFSGWLQLKKEIDSMVAEPNKNAKILVAHGTADDKVIFSLGAAAAEKLKELGTDVEMKKYPGMGHSASIEELSDLEDWLTKVVPPQDKDL